MYKGITTALVFVLVIALIGTGYWGYQENQEKNSILIKAENQYQRAFHDLNFHINSLNDELGKALVVNSKQQLSPSLANVWRLSYSAQADLSQLPLVLMPFSKTEEFLANVADFSYRIAIRDLDNEPLTAAEYKNLNTLYKNSIEIQNELNSVQEKVLDKQLRWMDVEIALAEEDKKMDNTIIDGLKTIDKKVQEFPEVDWGPGVQSLEKKRETLDKNLKGKSITASEAKKKAIEFLDRDNVTDVEVENVGKGAIYDGYSVAIHGEETVYLDVTKKGGSVVWMMINREIKNTKLDSDQALNKAQAFLRKHNYTSMVPITATGFDHTLIFNFAYKEQDVIVYPDIVSVKVALDNGEILGFQSSDYLNNHHERKIPQAKLTEEQIKKNVNPNVKVTSTQKALIESFDGDEVLTYEITGELNNNVYRIYLNAITGAEETIQKVTKDEIE